MKKHLQIITLALSTTFFTFPVIALAFIDYDIFDVLADIVNSAIVALIGVATLVFMYGVVIYVIAKGDEKQLSSGKMYMVWGIIGLTVMVAAWGLVNLIIFTIFGTTDISSLPSPSIPGISGLGGRSRCEGAGECIGKAVDAVLELTE